jgi:hypothetical protein
MTTRLAVAVLLAAGGCLCAERVPSPSGDRFAQYTECSVQNPCIPEVIITDRDGMELRRFQVRDDEGPCASILNLEWAGENAIGAECNGNPSVSYYFEVDVASARVLDEYLGYRFVRSPDHAKLAHAGWIMHFAPPWTQSEYLQVGNVIVYPLPAGAKPVVQKRLEMAPEVVKEHGLVYSGVHSFPTKFLWSPDSRNIGLIDCLVDCRLRDHSEEAFDGGGEQENRRCFAVIVALDGSFRRARIPDNPDAKFGLKWADALTLVATSGGKTVEVRAPQRKTDSKPQR